MSTPSTLPGDAQATLRARWALRFGYGALLLVLLFGVLDRQAALVRALLPIAVLIGWAQYATA